MKESLLQYYQDELSYLRNQGLDFAKSYPKIASRLRLGPGNTEDPFVGRLLESFAFLTARVQHKLDSQLNVISHSILNLLYPNYLAPVPSFTTLQFKPNEHQDSDIYIEKYDKLNSKTLDGKVCHFMTCYPVQLPPVKIKNTKYRRESLIKPMSEHKNSKSSFSFKIKKLENVQDIQNVNLKKLRFYINLPQQTAFKLHKIMLKNVTEMQVSSPASGKKGRVLSSENIKAVGFSDVDNLLPNYQHTETAQSILTDFFVYPQKFLYLDIENIDGYICPESKNEVQVTIFFNQYIPELEPVINESSFLLGCTPIVNLFETFSSPIKVNHQKEDYHLVPDYAGEINDVEIFQLVDMDVSSGESEITCRPFFGYKYADDPAKSYINWYHYRKSCEELGVYYVPGAEVFINVGLRNIAIDVDSNQNLILNAKLLCSNRDMATQLPFGGENPIFRMQDADTETRLSIKCISGVTAPIYRDLNKITDSDLIALLTLGQVSLDDSEKTKALIQNILSLYYYDNFHESEIINSSILSVKTKRITKRHPEQLKFGFCQGILMTLEIDISFFPDGNDYLFGSVLHHYLTKTCSVNTFVELSMQNKYKEELYRWEAKLGMKSSV